MAKQQQARPGDANDDGGSAEGAAVNLSAVEDLAHVVHAVRKRAGDRRRGAMQAVVVHGVVERVTPTKTMRWIGADGQPGETVVRKFLVTCEGRKPSAAEAERRRAANIEVQPTQQLWCEVRGPELCRAFDPVADGVAVVKGVGQLVIEKKVLATYVTARMYSVELVD